MESKELKYFLKGVGNAIHSINTLAVALSKLPDEGSVDFSDELNISWDPENIRNSKIMSRRFAVKSAYVYAAENFFVYLDSISKNAFWIYDEINFSSQKKKAIRVNNFLSEIPHIDNSQSILCELLCHWRNRIVHEATSNASLSRKKRQYLQNEKQTLYYEYHHFDIDIALKNFKNQKITLKDASTLITISIKCSRKIDDYFHDGHNEINDVSEIRNSLLKNSNFKKIYKQQPSEKKLRQSTKWLELNYPYLSEEIKQKLFS